MDITQTKWMKISDITKRYPSHPFRSRINNLNEEKREDKKLGKGFNVLQMKDVTKKGINWSTVFRTEVTSNKSPSLIKNEDILVVAKGSQNFAFLFKNNKQGSIPTICTPQFHHLRVKDTKVCVPEYLIFIFNQEHIQYLLEIQTAGTATKNLRSETLENIEIPLPPLQTQKKIVELNKNINKQNEIYENLIINGNKTLQSIAAQINKK